jgi:parallel beta-helix repeat protein
LEAKSRREVYNMSFKPLLIPVLMLTLILSLFQNCMAETQVDSDIEEDTIWVEEGSPYIIDSIIKVHPGATLTIEPGVKVQFAGWVGEPMGGGTIFHPVDSGLEIHGTLIAEGTSDKKIIFTSYPEDAGAGEWERLQFLYNAASNESSLSYCEIRDASHPIIIEGASPRISNSLITSYTWEAIELSANSNAYLDNNTIEANGRISAIDVDSSSPTIENNVITYESYPISEKSSTLKNVREVSPLPAGIHIRNGSKPIVRHNEIEQQNVGIYITSDSDPKVSKNVFKECTDNIIDERPAQPEVRSDFERIILPIMALLAFILIVAWFQYSYCTDKNGTWSRIVYGGRMWTVIRDPDMPVRKSVKYAFLSIPVYIFMLYFVIMGIAIPYFVYEESMGEGDLCFAYGFLVFIPIGIFSILYELTIVRRFFRRE